MGAMSCEWHGWMLLVEALMRPSGTEGVRCPHCVAHTVEHRFHAGSDRRGYGALWCATCLHGVVLSRMEFPSGVETLPLGSAKPIPRFEVVKP